MDRRTKRIIRISAVSAGSVLLLLLVGTAVVLNFVFTPSKLTPVVERIADRSLNARLRMGGVELTFFSTFPRFGVKLTDGTLVSTALRDTLWQRTDTLLTFRKAVLVFNPVSYLRHRKIDILKLSVDSADVYAFRDGTGRANWDILPSADTLASGTAADTTADTVRTVSEISVRHVALRHGSVTFDDRETKVFANIRDAGLRLRARLGEGHSMLALDFRNRNILFWQDGELLVNRVATRLRASVELDRAQRTLTLHDALLGINGTELDLTGTVRRDTARAGALLLDLRYGLHAPSLETVLHMIPESVLKRGEVAADGEVRISGAVKGPYGRQALPLATLDAEIKDASARYAGMPYGVDALDARLVGQVDPMRREPSFCNLEIFRFKGAHTDILADAEVKNLLDDPLVSFHTKSAVDLTALAQTFPLQEGVSLSGKLEAELRMSCRLSALRNRDLGRIRARGRVVMDSLALRDTARKFEFTSSASLSFAGDDRLDAEAEIRHASLRSPRLSSSMERLAATVRTTNPQDTTRIARMECTMTLNRLKAAAGDSLSLFCGRGTATVRLQPGKRDPAKPKVGLALEADTLFCRVGDSRMGMDRAGIGVTAEKLRDSVWIPEGIVGFSRLVVSTPQCALPIRMEKTSVTVGNRAVTLRNATMRIGRSDLTASGVVHDLYGAMRRRRPLRAELSLSSRNLNCNQLIRAVSFPADTLRIEADTAATDLKLFVVPKNIDFALHTDFRRVRYGKFVFEDVRGAVDVRDGTVHLKGLAMKGLDAVMHTTLLYQAVRPERGYVGFDFRLRRINVGKLVEFTPSLDSIVPMLRSFRGTVDFDGLGGGRSGLGAQHPDSDPSFGHPPPGRQPRADGRRDLRRNLQEILLQEQGAEPDRQHCREYQRQGRIRHRLSLRRRHGPLPGGRGRHAGPGHEFRLPHFHPQVADSLQAGAEHHGQSGRHEVPAGKGQIQESGDARRDSQGGQHGVRTGPADRAGLQTPYRKDSGGAAASCPGHHPFLRPESPPSFRPLRTSPHRNIRRQSRRPGRDCRRIRYSACTTGCPSGVSPSMSIRKSAGASEVRNPKAARPSASVRMQGFQ